MREAFDYIFIGLAILAFYFLRQMFLYIKNNMLTNYFNEKGKNLASKEDIEELTEKVEFVKIKFTEETENLKSRLNIIQNLQNNLLTEERNAIVDFNQKLFAWLNGLMDFHFNGIDIEVNSEIAQYKKYVDGLYVSYLSSETRFLLFIEDQNLITQALNLKVLILDKLLGIFTQQLLSFRHHNEEVEALFERIPQGFARLQLLQELVDKKVNTLRGYVDEMNNRHATIMPSSRTFQKDCRAYLYNLLQKKEVS